MDIELYTNILTVLNQINNEKKRVNLFTNLTMQTAKETVNQAIEILKKQDKNEKEAERVARKRMLAS
jgi:uncharacterized protein with NAD-binding domain and iron-sulfur cluster